ncbi:2-phospho-L-lactate transferase [archaeon HR06]|nr:2-phospho-L-lactate transferase [archaeon HR06]
MIVSLAGGTGSVKLLRGLSKLLKPEELKIIGNVGDNFWFYGLYICPDLDTVMYGLSENLDLKRGWGIKDDTFKFMSQLSSLGYEDWFLIGDRDLATHVIRTYLLKKGNKLDKVTRILCDKYGVKQELLPCTNDPLETWILTDIGEMHLQEFWVKRKAKDKVLGVKYKGSEKAEALKEALDYIFESKAIVICPANPISSISPILSLKSLRESLKGRRVIAISPIIGDKPVSGPAGKMMEGLNLKVSPFEVAKLYSDFLKIFIVDKKDKDYIPKIKDLGIEALSEDIIMKNREDEERLASFILSLFR